MNTATNTNTNTVVIVLGTVIVVMLLALVFGGGRIDDRRHDELVEVAGDRATRG